MSTSTPRVPEGGAVQAYQPSARDRLYVWLTALFVACLLMANILGVKLFKFQLGVPAWLREDGLLPVEHTVGMISFPITFVLTDLMNEYYGKRATRRAILTSFVMAAMAFGLIWIGRQMPTLEGIPGTADAESFERIFGASSLMYLASIVAFLVGSMFDVAIFGVFKRLTGGRFVWLRATGSTVISQVFDSLLVTFIFFWVLQQLTWAGGSGQPASMDFIMRTAATGYILKFVIAIALTPVIYFGRWGVRRFLGLQPLPPE